MTQTARADHATYLATRHFASLDGLRFICISAVIWHHLPLWLQMKDTITLATRGHVGVDFFFVLSGYLITTLLLREEAVRGTFSLRAFYWRRALRIIPIYFFVITVAAFYSIVLRGRAEGLEVLPYYYLFLSNFISTEHIGFLRPTWSLSMEEQFYLLWPALLLLLPRRWITLALIGLIAANLAAVFGVFDLVGLHGFDVGPLYFAISGLTYAPLLLGALLAIALHHEQSFNLMRPVLAFTGAPVFWLACLLVALASLPSVLEGWPNVVVHSLMTLMLGSLVAREDNAMAPLLRFAPIERIGQISYGIYLYHLFALAAVGQVFETMGWSNLLLVGVLYYALAIVIAEISFRTLEAWPMKYRKSSWGRLGGISAR